MRTEYRFSLLWMLLMAAVGALLMVILLGMWYNVYNGLKTGETDSTDVLLAIPLSLLLGIPALLIPLGMLMSKLTISPEGVEYRNIAYTAFAPWDRVGYQPNARYARRVRADLLVFHPTRIEPTGMGTLLPWKKSFEREEVKVPLNYFQTRWKRRSLGDDIRRHMNVDLRPRP